LSKNYNCTERDYNSQMPVPLAGELDHETSQHIALPDGQGIFYMYKFYSSCRRAIIRLWCLVLAWDFSALGGHRVVIMNIS